MPTLDRKRPAPHPKVGSVVIGLVKGGKALDLFGEDHRKAILAGFIGTAALSVLMVLKMLAGIAPQLNPIRELMGNAFHHRISDLGNRFCVT